VDVVSLPGSKLNGKERAKALRYLLGCLSNQESNAEAVVLNVAAPATALLGDGNPEVRRLACDVLRCVPYTGSHTTASAW
jgi:hypothetical protein